jgi:hypothetical protein
MTTEIAKKKTHLLFAGQKGKENRYKGNKIITVLSAVK